MRFGNPNNTPNSPGRSPTPEDARRAIDALQHSHPEYDLTYVKKEFGPSDNPIYSHTYFMGDEEIGHVTGSTKEEARNASAVQACKVLDSRGYFR